MRDIVKWLVIMTATVLGVAALARLGHAQQAQGPRPQTIYGDDDRLDVYQAKNGKLVDLERSTVGLFQSWNVAIDTATNTAKLATRSYAQEYDLCPGERFYDQQVGAFCSGSLVAPDIIMTAGHCVTDQDSCASTKFVFGFSIYKEGGKSPSQVSAGDVYGCKELLSRQQEAEGADWALVRLDRAVTDRKPLQIDRGASLAKGAQVFVIGHPAGLPTKIAGGATVRDPSPDGFFVANLDTYGGNSGSAVFNAVTGLVEGILVRGENDYVWKDGCRVSNVCPSDGCRGEDVTKVAVVAPRIPAPGAQTQPGTQPAEPPVASLPPGGPASGRIERMLDRFQQQ